MIELVEVEPGKWRISRETRPVARSNLPLPYVISDTMDPLEQVDGRYYTSKAAFRRVGRSLGLVEVGNEKMKPKQRSTASRETKEARRLAVRKAVARVKGL